MTHVPQLTPPPARRISPRGPRTSLAGDKAPQRRVSSPLRSEYSMSPDPAEDSGDKAVVDEPVPTTETPAPEAGHEASTPPDAGDAGTTQTPPPEINLDALIAELKASLASSQTLLSTQATRLSTLTDLETEHAQLKDQYAFLVAAKEAVEKQLQEEVKRREMAEESVELLRGQVEQARRGVGMLQKQEKERKRLSHIPAGAGGLGLSTEAEEVLAPVEAPTSKASKRSSILVGRGHRRASSQSEPGDTLHVISRDHGATSPNLSLNLNAPRTGGLRELRLGSGTAPVSGTGGSSSSPVHQTSFFDDSTPLPIPPPMGKRQSSASIPTSTPLTESPSKSEEAALRSELAAVRAKLANSEEAREASEACLKALREFMAGGGPEGGAAEDDLLKNIRLPPLPTDKDPDELAREQEAQAKKGGAGGGWGFKLWKQGPMSPALSTAVEPPATPMEGMSPPPSVHRASITPGTGMSPVPTPGDLPTEGVVSAVPVSSTPLGSFVAGWTKGVVPGTPAADAKPATARSLSSFFSRKKDDQQPKDKDKDLPPPPPVHEEQVIDLGDDIPNSATRTADPAAPQKEARGDDADTIEGDGLAPSPLIKDGQLARAEESPKESLKSLKEISLESEAEAEADADADAQGKDGKDGK